MITTRRLYRTSSLTRLFLATLPLYLIPHLAHANPQDGNVTSGSANISESGKALNVVQHTDKAVIDWRSFDIAPDETTQFFQPGSTSLALNRVNTGNASQILGTLSANGNVVIVNQNGVFFGQGSQVNVNGLIASSADISNENFMGGNLHFDRPGNPTASIINEGNITVRDAGLVGFVAPNVSNSGVITANLGRVHLASGDTATVDLYGDKLMEVAVSDDVNSQLVSNTGKIEAAGGKIALTAAAGSQIVNSLITVKGELKAPAVAQRGGEIIIYAEGSNAVKRNIPTDKGNKQGSSKVVVRANINASGKGAGEKGGSVQVLGDHVTLESGTRIDASGAAGGGTVNIGGEYLGGNYTPTALTTIVAPDVDISVSALTAGNGGTAIVWSDVRTDYYGSIDARGGAQSGDGGFVETSGKQHLNMQGTVTASAAHGNAGNWLMDPYNVTISGATSNIAGDGGSPTNTFTPTGTATLLASSIEAALNSGTNVTVTTGSTGSDGADNGDITVSSAISKTAGGDATLTLSAYRNIIVNSAISSNTGELNMLFRADNGGNGSGYISIAAALTSNGGDITMGGGSGTISAGSGFATGNVDQVRGIAVTNSAITAGGGNIIMNGRGYNTSTGSNHGVFINGASSNVSTTDMGTIDLTGYGGGATPNSGSNEGVYISAATVSTVNNALNITGTGGGAGTGANNYGVDISSGNATVKTTGTGNITINATGGNASGSGGSNYGFYVGSLNGVQAVSTGNITINGTGGNGSGNANTNIGVVVNVGSITGNGGAISINGTSGNSSGGSNYGVRVTGAGGAISNTGLGSISIIGQGRGTGNSGSAYGVSIDTGGVVSTINGALNVTGTGGGAGSGANNYGVYVNGSNSTIKTTGIGNMTVTGTGGNAGGTGANNHGVNLTTANSIQATSTGSITIDGTGGASSGATNLGVSMSSASIAANGGNIGITALSKSGGATANARGLILTTSSITNTGSGNITAVATGGNGTGGNNRGIYLISGSTISTVNGNIDLTGYGGTGSGGANYGVSISGTGTNNITASGTGNITLTGYGRGTSGANSGLKLSATSGAISSAGGNIALTGYGSTTSAGASNYGIELESNDVYTSGTGNVTINGTGGGMTNSGSNYGVYVYAAGNAYTANGTLSVTGTGGGAGTGTNNYGVYVTDASSTLKSTGSGDVNVTGIRGGGDTSNNTGLVVAVGNGIQTTGSGNITIAADKLTLSNANNINSIGNLTIKPHTAGTSMGIGTAATGTLNLPTTYFSSGYLNWGNVLKLGDGVAGAMEINTSYAFTKPVVFQNQGANDITITGQALNSSSASTSAITIASARNFVNSVGSGGINMSGGGKWLVYSTNPASDTINSLPADYRRFSCTYGGSCPTLGTGNGYLYSYTPTLTVTPSSVSAISYGDAVPSLSGYAYTLSGYLASDSSADGITGSITGTTTYTQGSNVGTYNVNYLSGSLASALGYAFSYANNASALTVNKRAITAAVQNQTVTYGNATPTQDKTNASHVVWSNLYGSDTGTDLDSVTFSYGSATAGSNNNAGSYTLGISAFSDNNYSMTLPGGVTNGTLTVNPAALSITADNKSRSYGSSNPAFTVSYSGFVNGDNSSQVSGLNLASTATSSSNVGTYTITLSGATASNYDITMNNGSLAITPAMLTVIANDYSRLFGEADPTFTGSINGFVNGDDISDLIAPAVFSTSATRNSIAGTYAITASGASAVNYDFNYVSGELSISGAAIPTTVSHISQYVPNIMTTGSSLHTAPTASFSNNNYSIQMPTYNFIHEDDYYPTQGNGTSPSSSEEAPRPTSDMTFKPEFYQPTELFQGLLEIAPEPVDTLSLSQNTSEKPSH